MLMLFFPGMTSSTTDPDRDDLHLHGIMNERDFVEGPSVSRDDSLLCEEEFELRKSHPSCLTGASESNNFYSSLVWRRTPSSPSNPPARSLRSSVLVISSYICAAMLILHALGSAGKWSDLTANPFHSSTKSWYKCHRKFQAGPVSHEIRRFFA